MTKPKKKIPRKKTTPRSEAPQARVGIAAMSVAQNLAAKATALEAAAAEVEGHGDGSEHFTLSLGSVFTKALADSWVMFAVSYAVDRPRAPKKAKSRAKRKK